MSQPKCARHRSSVRINSLTRNRSSPLSEPSHDWHPVSVHKAFVSPHYVLPRRSIQPQLPASQLRTAKGDKTPKQRDFNSYIPQYLLQLIHCTSTRRSTAVFNSRSKAPNNTVPLRDPGSPSESVKLTNTQTASKADTMMSTLTSCLPFGNWAKDEEDLQSERPYNLQAKPTSNPPHRSPSLEPQVTKHTLRSTSAPHCDVKAYQQQINKARTAHAQTCARYPGIDQTRIPAWVIVSECSDGPSGDQVRMFRHKWREEILLQRIAKSVGLREWEWSVGEPFDPAAVDDETDSAPETNPTSYAKRRAAFTYTYGDDPVFRGRKVVLGRGRRRGLCYVPGDFCGLVSREDEAYMPDREDVFSDRTASALREEITAGDFLTALGQRGGTCGGDDDGEDADSVFSAMSDECSDEDEDDPGLVERTC